MKRPELQITNGEMAGKQYVVREGGIRLGRSSSNDIHIPDEELSRNHCMFEPIGEDGVRLTDLASANGTFLNGKLLGNDPAILKIGDLIEVGGTVLKVVGETPAPSPGAVDLGLGGKTEKIARTKKRRSPIVNLLWLVVLAVGGAAIYLVLFEPSAAPEKVVVVASEEKMVVEEMVYEKVEATSEGIYRYELTLNGGVLKVEVDDVPKENRHLVKQQELDEKSLAELNDILSYAALREIDREYAGAEPDPPALNSFWLKVVYNSHARSVRIVNTQEPDAFKAIRERLETFSKNQLGVWALQYSRDKLVELAEDAISLGKAKWDDREVQYGNLFGSVAAYQEAIFYLETVDPKPDCIKDARAGLEAAKGELERRYRDQRFLADRAINLKQWDVAKRELGVLIEMVPDRNDERNREASAKMVDVEKRLKGDK